MMGPDTAYSPKNTINASLERHYITEYLQQRGYTLEDLVDLNPILAKEIKARACRHASLKLAEIEATSQFMRKFHN